MKTIFFLLFSIITPPFIYAYALFSPMVEVRFTPWGQLYIEVDQLEELDAIFYIRFKGVHSVAGFKQDSNYRLAHSKLFNLSFNEEKQSDPLSLEVLKDKEVIYTDEIRLTKAGYQVVKKGGTWNTNLLYMVFAMFLPIMIGVIGYGSIPEATKSNEQNTPALIKNKEKNGNQDRN